MCDHYTCFIKITVTEKISRFVFILADDYFKIVMESSQYGGNLFTAESLQSMCKMEEEVFLSSRLVQCRGPSVSTMVAQMANKNCQDLNDTDVSEVLATLAVCAKFYHSKELSSACVYSVCSHVPFECKNKALAYVILHFLTDYNFLDPVTNSNKLTYALVGVSTTDDLGFYKEQLENGRLDNGLVRVRGIDSDIKFSLFNEYLFQDMSLFILSMLIILVILCLYLRSIVVTIATVLDVVFSFVLSYFIYHFVFKITYFPFMNILSILILIAVGADDVFVYFDAWQHVKEEYPNKSISFWVFKSMRHASLSIFVTSLTTASAFYSNFVSEIGAIKCFGIFCGTAILCNLLMMVTWIPAIIVIIELCTKKWCSKVKCCNMCDILLFNMRKLSDTIFGYIVPYMVIYVWYLWLILLTGMAICAVIIVFVHPRLQLPESAEFKVFRNDHPIERYAENLKFQFRFVKDTVENSRVVGQPITMIWGVKGNDNGNPLDPTSNPTLVFDDTFDLSLPEAQTWMLNLCLKVRNKPFVTAFYKQLECSIDLFNNFMKQDCYHESLEPCCRHRTPPFEPVIFKQCYPFYIKLLTYQVSLAWGIIGVPFFDAQSNIKAFKINFETTKVSTPAYHETNDFYQMIEDFMQEEKAPKSVSNGWFTGKFRFYDLQLALTKGTYISISLSLAVAFIVMLVTSLNILLTVYAIVTIAITIFLTVAVMVILGWELNILESLTISLAVGLSIDFSIHYGIAYRLSDNHHRILRVKDSFTKVGQPVAMAAITTFLAGIVICLPDSLNICYSDNTDVKTLYLGKRPCELYILNKVHPATHSDIITASAGQVLLLSNLKVRFCQFFKIYSEHKNNNFKAAAIMHMTKFCRHPYHIMY